MFNLNAEIKKSVNKLDHEQPKAGAGNGNYLLMSSNNPIQPKRVSQYHHQKLFFSRDI